MNIRIRVLRDTTGRLEHMDGQLDHGLRDIAKWAAGRMQKLAGEAVPVDTGFLKKRIMSQVHRVAGAGGIPAYRAVVGVQHGEHGYGPFVEFGTGQRGQFSHPIFAQRYGWPHIAYTPSWPGMIARPFLTPQPWAVKPEVDAKLQQLLFDVWHGYGG